ncbi:adhesion G protein-coupled receptor E1-like [Emydura macquarii macquarii]|uniref:adhesion G protein-coupled receptor E1-like n=1 Tax=Emydura macquarii macquarii TaxID=1129001 RepID=UPI003529D777
MDTSRALGKPRSGARSENTCLDVKCLGPSRADCRPHVRCISLAGSYYCNCIDGYESSSGEATFSGASDNTCHDIDECLGPSRADCGPHAHCTNTPGSYSCSCIDGYESSSGKATFRGASENTCLDIDECLGPSRADCGPHAHCTNTPGSYYCSCIDGYESSSGKATFRSASENTCLDVKCLGPSRAACRPHVRCISLAGSYYCNCIDGYESSSGEATFSGASDNTCHDIDECLGPSRADCGPHAHCTNTPGSYSCSCIDGYESSSGKATFRGASENTCLDIDECLGPSRADCGPHAHCTNTPGSYYCSCIDGYESSSGKATFRSASENTCLDVKCLGPSRAACRPHVRCISLAGSYYCNCIDGYESSSGEKTFSGASDNTCHDIDECLGPSRADCGPHAHCTNTPGSYSCSCIDGYESSSGKATFRGASENTCLDIDECLGPSRADCGPHAHCTNMPGSYYCSCIDGYESSSGKATFRSASENTCLDVKCLGPSRADCRPHVRCISLAGSYYCNCIDGYESSSGEATFSRGSDNTCHGQRRQEFAQGTDRGVSLCWQSSGFRDPFGLVKLAHPPP